MNYFKLKHSLDNEVVGAYPQVEDANYSCDVWDDPLFIDKYIFQNAPPDVKVANAILVKEAELTDLISASIIGFTGKLLISKKLKEILIKSKNFNFQCFKSPVLYRNILIDEFYTINPTKVDLEFLDYDKSEIYLMKNVFTKQERLNFSSYQEFNEFNKSLVKGSGLSVYIEKYHLRKNEINKDILVLKHVQGGIQYLVSDRLRNEIEDNNITGIEFAEDIN